MAARLECQHAAICVIGMRHYLHQSPSGGQPAQLELQPYIALILRQCCWSSLIEKARRIRRQCGIGGGIVRGVQCVRCLPAVGNDLCLDRYEKRNDQEACENSNEMNEGTSISISGGTNGQSRACGFR